MPEKEDNPYQNIYLARHESGHENNVCYRGHLNIDVLKNILDIIFYTSLSCSPLFAEAFKNLNI